MFTSCAAHHRVLTGFQRREKGPNIVGENLGRTDTEFRTPEQEVLKLLDECAELRTTLKAISAQIGRMEISLKTAFGYC
jgi:hypothetical protein